MDIPFDIKNMIIRYLFKITDIINMYNLNKDHQNNILITEVHDQENTIKMSQQVIMQEKYKMLEKINLSYNIKIKNLDHLYKTLIELNCSHSNINQKCIIKLVKLRKLLAASNANIYDVNHLRSTLVELDCSSNCGINQEGIQDLKKLQVLYLASDCDIYDVNHLADSLLELTCCHNSKIDQNGIRLLNKLKYLSCSCNKK